MEKITGVMHDNDDLIIKTRMGVFKVHWTRLQKVSARKLSSRSGGRRY